MIIRLLFTVLAIGALAGNGLHAQKITLPNQAKAMEAVALSTTSKPGYTYTWDFGDGQQASGTEVSHTFKKVGNLTVRLTATSPKGKSRTRNATLTVTPPDRCLALIQTPMGDMVAEIFDATPLHQDNFVKMVEQHYYDSLLFHRVINGFMIQGGDPDSKNAAPGKALGMGGPGYTIKAEFLDSLAHVKGALAAARTNNPQKRSSGSQFYIVQGTTVTDAQLDQMEARGSYRYPRFLREEYLAKGGTPFLDQEYTVFGRVVEGLEVIDLIAAEATDSNNRPKQDVWMVIRLIR